MMSSRTTFTLDDQMAEMARKLNINLSAAARDGVEAAVRKALAERDRAIYANHENGGADGEADTDWVEAEAWGDE